MRALDRFEQRVERLVNSAFARAFRSEVKPVEIVSAIRRAMDDRAAALSQTRTVVPNEFTVRLSASDLQRVTEWGAEALGQEIAAAATEYAASQDYAVLGPVTVAFTGDEELRTGRFHVQSETKRGTAAPASAGLTGEASSISEGFLLVVTILLWSIVLDALAYRWPRLGRILKAKAKPLIEDGKLNRRAMRRELMSDDELWSQLRLHGLSQLKDVKRAYLEPNGMVSIVPVDGLETDDPPERPAP